MYWNDTNLITVGINNPNFPCANVLIDIYTAALWFVVPVGAFYSYAVTSLTETFIRWAGLKWMLMKALPVPKSA
jgi:hypothetical protein